METNETFVQDEARPAPERIGFGKRLGAYLLDIIISGIVGAVIGIFAGTTLAAIFFSGDYMEGSAEAEAMGAGVAGFLGGMMGSIAGMVLILFLIMLLEAFTGQTIGKMMLGIKNGDADGAAASTGKLLGRAAIKYIGTLCTILAGVTGIAMISTAGSLLGFAVFIGCFLALGANKQALHDMIAKTAVYNKSDLG